MPFDMFSLWSTNELALIIIFSEINSLRLLTILKRAFPKSNLEFKINFVVVFQGFGDINKTS